MTDSTIANKSTIGSGTETVAGFVGKDYPAFFLQFRPVGPPRAHVVYLPPFGEEMNRLRSLVAEQARQFAREGLSCSILDFYGTGESRGDLGDANLSIWRQNIEDMLERVLQRTQKPVYLWGCRLGALLALDYFSFNPGVCSKLLLWQPVTSGSSFVTRMLRQRSISLMQKGEEPESTAEMKHQLAQGNSFEVAGYRLGGELMNAIDQLEVASMLQGNLADEKPEIVWLEHTADEGGDPGAKANRIIGELQEAGCRVVFGTFTGDPLWQLNKRGACDDLLTKTRGLKL
ncbi:MAG: alpha/beta hydrolase [Pseudohongiellaceae bacterium]